MELFCIVCEVVLHICGMFVHSSCSLCCIFREVVVAYFVEFVSYIRWSFVLHICEVCFA